MRFSFYCPGCDTHWSMMWTPFKRRPTCMMCGTTMEFEDD